MEPTMNVPLVGASACLTWVVALALIVLGLLPIRKAYGPGGYLFAAGGVLLFGRSLCWSANTVLFMANQEELLINFGAVIAHLGTFCDLLTLVACLAGIALVARAGVARGVTA